MNPDGSPKQGQIDVPQQLDGQPNPEFEEVANLLSSRMPVGTVALQVERVQNEGLWRRYYVERRETARSSEATNANEKRLWMGSGQTAPEVICNSEHGFDPTYGNSGSYSAIQAAYFAQEPLYSHSIRAHRVDAANPDNCALILAQVALGDVKDFGSEYASQTEREPPKPDGTKYGSWSGTEKNMQWPKDSDARCVVHNDRKKFKRLSSTVKKGCKKCQDALSQCKTMREDGERYGRQYIICRYQKAYPQYVVRYQVPTLEE
jgi:hypothetical protein